MTSSIGLRDRAGSSAFEARHSTGRPSADARSRRAIAPGTACRPRSRRRCWCCRRRCRGACRRPLRRRRRRRRRRGCPSAVPRTSAPVASTSWKTPLRLSRPVARDDRLRRAGRRAPARRSRIGAKPSRRVDAASRAAKAGARRSRKASGETRRARAPRAAAPRPRPGPGSATRLTPMPTTSWSRRPPVPGALEQDARHLAAVEQDVVRPFQREPPIRQRQQDVVQGQGGNEGEERRPVRRHVGAQGKARGEIASGHRPGAPAPAARGGLAAGEDPRGATLRAAPRRWCCRSRRG